MRRGTLIECIEELRDKYIYANGFFINQYYDTIIPENVVKNALLKNHGLLPKEIDEIVHEFKVSQLYGQDANSDASTYIWGKVKKFCENRMQEGKSWYFQKLDEKYPNNKFRQIFNCILFKKEPYAFFLIGDGRSGKSTMIDVLAKIVDTNFFARKPITEFGSAQDLASIEGKLLVDVSESQFLKSKQFEVMKDLITFGMVEVNPKGKSRYNLKPCAKYFFTANSFPYLDKFDTGYIRRMITVDMNASFEDDPDFWENIEKDIPHIIWEAYHTDFDKSQFYIEMVRGFLEDVFAGYAYLFVDNNTDLSKNYDAYCAVSSLMGKKTRSFETFLEAARLFEKYIDPNKEVDIFFKRYYKYEGIVHHEKVRAKLPEGKTYRSVVVPVNEQLDMPF